MEDWDILTDSLNHSLVFIYGKEFESTQNVATVFYNELATTQDYKIFQFYSQGSRCMVPLASFYDCLLHYNVKQRIGLKQLGKNIIKDVTQSDTIAYLMNTNDVLKQNTLSEQYREILIFIEEISQDVIPIFIFSNFSNYDNESQTLIQWMVARNLNSYYPFLKDAKYIFLCDENENFEKYNDLFILNHVDISLREPSVDNIQDIWSRNILQVKLAKPDLEKIFVFSGGKLSNIELIIKYLGMQKEIDWNGQNFVEFMTKIYDKRVADLKCWKNSIKELLGIAAEIGKSFDLRWVSYTLPEAMQKDYAILLDKCCSEQFITYEQDQGKFVSKFAWEYFYTCTAERKKEFCSVLAKTVEYFSPYDYYLRAFYLEQSGNEQTACELYLFEFWKRLKEGLILSNDFNKKLKEICHRYDCIEYIDILKRYYSSQSEGQYLEILYMLEEAEGLTNQPLRLLLLKDYLLACIYHKVSSDKQMAERAILLMENISEKSKEIREMAFWCDCVSTLISFYANIGKTNESLTLSKSLVYYYSQRKDYDNKAMVGIQVLNRKSSAYLSAEIAIKKTEESVNYFRKSMLYTQYLMALNNHGANSLVLGKYNQALACFNEAVTFIKRHPTVKINKVYLWNNFYLASFYTNISNRKVILKDMVQMVNWIQESELKIIPLINLAVFYVLTKKKEGIKSALECIEEAIQLNYELQDDFFEYYINSNLAAIYFLNHQYSDAYEKITKCLKPPSLMKSSEKIYFKKRANKWANVIRTKQNISFEDFDTYLLDEFPDDVAWKFIGRGFLPSDIQFWSES